MDAEVLTRSYGGLFQGQDIATLDVPFDGDKKQTALFSYEDEYKHIQTQVVATFASQADPINAFELLGKQHQALTEEVKIYGTNLRKHHGVYYTPYSVAYRVIADTLDANPPTLDRTFLEPCAGNGIFVIAYIDYVAEHLGLVDAASFQALLDRIYCAEIDAKAVMLLKASIETYVQTKYGVNVTVKSHNLYLGNSLYEVTINAVSKVNLKDAFGQQEGFDYIFTNPPYKLLKANSDRYRGGKAEQHKAELKRIISFLKQGKHYPLSQGALNLYKLFVEDIVANYLKKGGGVGLLLPQTILNDKYSTSLRKLIIENFRLTKVYILPEKATFFEGITQAFCLFGFNDIAASNRQFEVINNVGTEKDFSKIGYMTSASKLHAISLLEPIIATDQKGYQILHKLHAKPSIRQHKSLINLRGELDLTINKSHITTDPTPYRLIRGADVSTLQLITTGQEFVSPKFLGMSAKSKYVQRERIVCQQISNMRASHRLKFAPCPANMVLGNSVNFISVQDDKTYSPKALLAIMNSTILDWRFKLTSSNNHINNYEIDDLPLPAIPDPKIIRALEKCVDKPTGTSLEAIINEIDVIVAELYSLTGKELSYIKARSQ